MANNTSGTTGSRAPHVMTWFTDTMDSLAVALYSDPYTFLMWVFVACLPLFILSAYFSMRLLREIKQVRACRGAPPPGRKRYPVLCVRTNLRWRRRSGRLPRSQPASRASKRRSRRGAGRRRTDPPLAVPALALCCWGIGMVLSLCE